MSPGSLLLLAVVAAGVLGSVLPVWSTGRASMRGVRTRSAFVVAGVIAAALCLAPASDFRSLWLGVFVFTLGYGHLLGALVFALRRGTAPGGARWLHAVVAVAALGLGFGIYCELVAASAW
ncbi:MAG: hypothetical protein MJE66_05485, partial [Proteobacteria bacterium]|nr:hypothetical protein [Pseudomonadota bacterium]